MLYKCVLIIIIIIIIIIIFIINQFIKISYRDTDGAIVRPLPKIKRGLSEATCLPHIVQVRDD